MKPIEVFLGTNKPFFLDKNDHFWVVASGEVEIYSVRRASDGSLKSARNYLFTVEKGDIIFTLRNGTSWDEFSLIAVSPDSKLIEVHKSFIGSLNKDQLSHKIERWVAFLASVVQTQKQPKVYLDIQTPDSITLNRKQVAYPSKGLLWGQIQEGSVALFGKQEAIASPENTKNVFLPTSNELWMEALESDTRLSFIDTRQLVEDDIALMLSIHYVQAYFLSELEESFERKIQVESQSLQQRTSRDEESITESLSKIRSIVYSDGKSVDFTNENTGNDLFATCQLIGSTSGFTFTEPKFVRDFARNLTGQLDAIAQVSNVRMRKVILRGKWWAEENGHLLAFTKEEKAPIALIQAKPGEYLLRNVADKSERIVTQTEAETLDPIAYMFLYSFNERMSSVKKIGKYAIRGLKLDGTYIIIAALAGSMIGLLTPMLSGVLFDDVIPQADRSFLWEVFSIMLIIGLVKALLELVRGILLLRVETKSNISIQAGLMDHLLRLPVTFYRRFSAGDLTVRALGINAIRQILSNAILTTVLSGAFSIVNLILLFTYDVSLAWVGVGLSFLAITIIASLGFMKLKFDRQTSDKQGEIQGFLFEFLSGINKIRVSGSEKRFFSLWANKFTGFKSLGFKSGNYQNFVEVFTGSYSLLTNLFFFGFIYYMLQQATSPQTSMISVGVFMAFISAFNQFLNDCLSMSMGLISSLNIVPLYERVKPILDEEPESAGEAGDPGELTGEIEFNSVSFRYAEDQPLVLSDVSFKIKPGEMVAFVGPSGSGKSTIMRILLGFEQNEMGSVFYDGQAFDTLNKELVRRQIGVVLQNGSLMSGSIYQNIVGNSELTLEDAQEAARMAGLEEDIEQMPMGMHTVISEGASTFSGGQRQRLMIARAIVHKPRILYMDEATSALDNRTQTIVSESLDRLQATRIVIAHRLSTIVNADTIHVVDKGVIVESGNYDELMEKGGLFSMLAKRQIV
jgi:NHLM bacteriocin system ABC transporter ATP-binding protein